MRQLSGVFVTYLLPRVYKQFDPEIELVIGGDSEKDTVQSKVILE